MIEVFKLLNGFDHLEMTGNFLKLDKGSKDSRTRGHTLKLSKPRHRTWKRNQFFPSRVVKDWNKLPAKVISCKTINSFKHNYDQYQKTTRRQS